MIAVLGSPTVVGFCYVAADVPVIVFDDAGFNFVRPIFALWAGGKRKISEKSPGDCASAILGAFAASGAGKTKVGAVAGVPHPFM